MARCGAMAQLRATAARRQAASRLLTPSGLALALICFLFGFLAVSCDTPGGYGRSKQGGTTTYTGLDLATGAQPTVDPAFRQPAPTTRPDLLGWQPAVMLAALALAVAAIAGAGWFRSRRRVVVASTATALVLLVLGEVTARDALVTQVAEQVPSPLPAGKEPADYVVVGGGFTMALTITTIVLVSYVVAHLRRRSGTVS
jgi:hypothetical protein